MSPREGTVSNACERSNSIMPSATAPRPFDSPTALAALAAVPDVAIGQSDWLAVTQAMINAFADLTGDRQWIHVDVERARREAPGGQTIAHGYLLVGLIGVLQPQIFSVVCPTVLNYGMNKLRFLTAVPSGSRVRLSQAVKSAEQVKGGWRIEFVSTLEVEGQQRPGFVAEIVFQYQG